MSHLPSLSMCAGVTRVQLARQQRTVIKGQQTILIPGINNTMLVSGAQLGGAEFKSHERCTSKDNGFYPGKPCGPPSHVHLNQVGAALCMTHLDLRA